MSVGTAYAPEWKTYDDAQTGRRVTQLTDSSAEDYHLYFYNWSVTPDDKYLIFNSERTGVSNLFRLDLGEGTIVQLTDAKLQRADYYPFTYAPIYGVGSCLSVIGTREVFYFVGNDLYGVNFETFETRPLLNLPADSRASMLHTNGRDLVFATWDEKVFAEPAPRTYAERSFPADEYWQGTTSTIIRLDTETGACEEILRKENFWINHVLIHPHNRDLILFCHEYSAQPDRMWLLNMATGECTVLPGQAESEWYEHEFWSADGERVCFHGGSREDTDAGFCGWYTLNAGTSEKFYHRTPGRAYGHYNLHGTSRTMITDGEAEPGCISSVRCAGDKQEFEVLCRHDSYKFDDDQRCHPHPSFTHDGTRVIFTSNRTGTSNVYMTEW